MFFLIKCRYHLRSFLRPQLTDEKYEQQKQYVMLVKKNNIHTPVKGNEPVKVFPIRSLG